MVRKGVVDTAEGEVPIVAETVCVHGDGVHAVQFARVIHAGLTREGIRVVSPVIDPDATNERRERS
jgi:5-oxoprolinase (ATP-hydrolysing) subunit A